MGFLMIQNDFSHGELDRRMFSREDLAVYNKAAQKLRNVVVIPQGGARRRFGSIFIKTIVQNTDRYMMTEFQFDGVTKYLFLLEPAKLTIFFKDPITGITSQVFTQTTDIPWTSEDLLEQKLRFTQTTNRMIITGPFHPMEIIRGPDETLWAIAALIFKNEPTQTYPDMIFGAINFTLSEVSVGQDRTLKANSPIFTLESPGGMFKAVGPPESLGRIGVARITGFVWDDEVKVEILSEFDASIKIGAGGVLGTNVDLEVPAFSAERGWPVASTFYEGRLWFGGTTGGRQTDSDLPQTLFGSVINDFGNFDTGVGDPDDAIQVTIATDKSNIIRFLIGDRTLQILTDSAEFGVPQENEQAVTPTTVSVRKQTNNGAKNVEPIVLDNQTFYVAKGGKRVMGYAFQSGTLAYQSINISLLSSSLIRNPIDSAVLKGSTTDDADYLMFVNNDGTLAIFQSLAVENVAAWTLSELEDDIREAKFRRITQVGETIYAIIERVDATLSLTTEVLDEPILTEDGEEILAEEASLHELVEFSFDVFTDSASQQSFTTPTTVITNLFHLDDKTVHIRGEIVKDQGFYVFPPAVVLGGQITLDTAVVTVEVGLPFIPLIQPLPVQSASQQIGQTLYTPKRLTRFFIDFYESLGVFVDGVLLPYLAFGNTVLDQPPQIKTGLVEQVNLGGWNRRQAPLITQSSPVPMTILGIGYEVEI